MALSPNLMLFKNSHELGRAKIFHSRLSNTDVLFPSDGLKELERAMKADSVNAQYKEIETIDGHDAFLTDWQILGGVVKEFLSDL